MYQVISFVLRLLCFLDIYSVKYIEKNKFNYIQQLIQYNHIEFKSKAKWQFYEN